VEVCGSQSILIKTQATIVEGQGGLTKSCRSKKDSKCNSYFAGHLSHAFTTLSGDPSSRAHAVLVLMLPFKHL
jgi:hypothetical protein